MIIHSNCAFFLLVIVIHHIAAVEFNASTGTLTNVTYNSFEFFVEPFGSVVCISTVSLISNEPLYKRKSISIKFGGIKFSDVASSFSHVGLSCAFPSNPFLVPSTNGTFFFIVVVVHHLAVIFLIAFCNTFINVLDLSHKLTIIPFVNCISISAINQIFFVSWKHNLMEVLCVASFSCISHSKWACWIYISHKSLRCIPSGTNVC